MNDTPRLTGAVSGRGTHTITPGPGAVAELLDRLEALDVASAADALDALVERGALVGDVDHVRAELRTRMEARRGPGAPGVHDYVFRPGGRPRAHRGNLSE